MKKPPPTTQERIQRIATESVELLESKEGILLVPHSKNPLPTIAEMIIKNKAKTSIIRD